MTVGVGVGVAEVVFGDASTDEGDVLIEFEKDGIVLDTVTPLIAGVWFSVFVAVSADVGVVFVPAHCVCS